MSRATREPGRPEARTLMWMLMRMLNWTRLRVPTDTDTDAATAPKRDRARTLGRAQP